MPMTLDEIVEATREMPADTVSELVDRIQLARHSGTPVPVAEAWHAELHDRVAELSGGQVTPVPLVQSLARARGLAGL